MYPAVPECQQAYLTRDRLPHCHLEAGESQLALTLVLQAGALIRSWQFNCSKTEEFGGRAQRAEISLLATNGRRLCG